MDDFSLSPYTSGISPSGINSFNGYLFHIYNVPMILPLLLLSRFSRVRLCATP